MVVRRFPALVVVAALVAVAASTSSAGNPTSPCRAAHLRGHLLDRSGAAGTILVSITLTNTGTFCSLKGYTRLQLMASARRTLPTHVVHGGLAILNGRPKNLVLAHGGVASVLIAYSDVPHGSERSCPTGREILVRVPGDRTWIPVLARTDACGQGRLEESPLLSGKRHAA